MIRLLSAPSLVLFVISSALAAPGVRIEETPATALALEGDRVPQFRVTTDAYSAEVFQDGRVRVVQGETVLLKGLALTLGGRPEPLAAPIRQTGDTLHLRIGTAKKPAGDPLDALLEDDDTLRTPDKADLEQALPDSGGVDLSFHADRIELKVQKLTKARAPKGSKVSPPQYELTGSFGDEAVGVLNLRNGTHDALPARRIASPHMFSFLGFIGHYWPEVEITHNDGTRVKIEGIDGINHADPRRDAERMKREPRGHWSLREATEGKQVTLTVLPAEVDAFAAAPLLTLTPARPRALFYEDEPVVYHVALDPASAVDGTWRATWTLDDHRGAAMTSGSQDLVIANGTMTPSSITIDMPRMGYAYGKLEIHRPDVPSARRTFSLEIARIRPEHPELRELDERAGSEVLWANILGMRGVREVLSWQTICETARREDGSYDWDKAMEGHRRLMELSQGATARTWTSFLGAEAWPKALNKAAEVERPEVSAAPLGSRSRATDELDLTLEEPAEAPEAKPEARRDATPPGPQPPPPDVQQKELFRYLSELAREGAKIGINAWEPINEPDLVMSQQRYLDQILKPQYPAVKAGNPDANFLGGSLCGLEKHTWLRKLYELGGQEYFDDVSMHPYTPVGFQEVYRRHLQEYFDLFAEYGEPETRLWMTEAAHHRGWGYNDYVYDRMNAYRESQARMAVNMILNAEAMSVPRQQIAVFYYTEHGYNDFYLVRRGSLTSAAVSLQVMNENLRDAAFERELPLPTPGHHFQLFRDEQRTVAVAFTADEPVELRLLTDAPEVQVTDMMGNRSAVTPQDGRLALTISGDPTYLQVAADQFIRPDHGALPVQPNLALATFGASATASASDPACPPEGAISGDWTAYSLGRRHGWKEPDDGKDQFPDWYEVRLPEPTAVERIRIFLDYGAWERVARDYEVQVFSDGQWLAVDKVEGNRWRHVYDHRFEPVVTDRVRVQITHVNSCLFEDVAWLPKVSSLRAVEVYAKPEAGAAGFFVQELPDQRPMRSGETTSLTFRFRNTQAQPLKAQMRLVLPPGITSAQPAQPVEVDPGEEVEYTFDVTMAADAPAGTLTVAAGVFADDRLVSSDYASRVLTSVRDKAAVVPAPATPPAADPDAAPRDALDVINQAQPEKDE